MMKRIHIVRVENGNTLRPIPRSECISPVTEPRCTSSRVPLSGLLASLLLRAGRMLNAAPKSTGPETLNLFCAPLPNGGLSYVGLVSETPASYSASAIPCGGSSSDLTDFSNNLGSKKNVTRFRDLSFRRVVDTCLADNIGSNGAAKERLGGSLPLAFSF